MEILSINKVILILAATFTVSVNSAYIRTYRVLEGDNLLVICNTTDTQESDVYWSKSDNSYQQKGRRLEILGIKRTGGGEYKCHAQRPSPEINGTYVNVTVEIINVDVQYPAEIVRFDVTPAEVLENDSFTITCEVQGNPDPDWVIRNNYTGTMLWKAKSASRAVIGPINASSSDAGFWECTGRNVLNNGVNVTKGDNLRVNCPPRPLSNNNFTMMVLFLGQSVELVMEVESFPVPKFTWSRLNGKKLSPYAEQMDSRNTSILKISSVQISDFGEYILNVENKYGVYTAKFFLIPNGPPMRPTNLRFSDVTDTSVTLQWTSGYDMGTPQHFYIVKLFNGNAYESISEWIYDNSTNHGINDRWTYVQKGLESNTFYNLSLMAENAQHHYTSGITWPPVTFWTKAGTTEIPTLPPPSVSVASSYNVSLFIGLSLLGTGALMSMVALLYFMLYRIKRSAYEPIVNGKETVEKGIRIDN